MQAAGVYDTVSPKLVLGENVAQAMQFVQSGSADAGLVALSLALAPAVKGKGRLFEIPDSTYPRLEQGGTILKWAVDVDAARALRGILLSAAGKAILTQSGFSVPPAR
jgi:molybdate transport system substrate-binding protein